MERKAKFRDLILLAKSGPTLPEEPHVRHTGLFSLRGLLGVWGLGNRVN